MSGALARWNGLPSEEAVEEILPCCGSRAWARGMAARRPILEETALFSASDEVWSSLPESDWMEAFRSHPRIGESPPPACRPARAAGWSGEEQRQVGSSTEELKAALAEGNRAYEQR